MLIAHIPVGYLTAKALKYEKKSLIIASMIFAVLPDLGLIYFYLFSNRQISHRQYFPHLPIIMVTAFLVILPLWRTNFFEKFKPYYVLFFVNWAIHLLLDTFTERIYWLWPFSGRGFMLVEIPAAFGHWIISFVLHWSFAVELAIIAIAGAIFLKSRRASRL